MEPQIQYATTSDGVSIACAALGEGPAIVFAPNIWGDLHLYASRSSGHEKTDALIERGWQVVLYDGRGCGYSARSATDFSLEARLRDLDAVIGVLGVNRVALCGRVMSSLTAIAYAVEHPERVSRLALINAYACGADLVEAIPSIRATRALMSVAVEQWDFYTLNMANAITGFSDSERARRQAAIYRAAMSPEAYLANWNTSLGIDVTLLLASVRVPTLVVHDKSDTFGDFSSLARGIASRIAGARLVSTEDPAAAIDQFLREGDGKAAEAVALPEGTATILFADIADSTALTERLGDAAFRAKAAELDAALRTAIRESGGTPVEGRLVGDGLMAVFTSAHQAIEAAVRCAEQGNHIGLPLHLGLHAGDVTREGNNVYGGAVNIAARVAGESAPGEVLASDVVRTLARTSAGVTFEDKGDHMLKGVSEPVRIWAVNDAEVPPRSS
jgi:class 3 adenylate cyclase